jgi:hypothetical protein
MFEYEKLILQKVSFSNDLFKKELIKSIKELQNDELDNFKVWVMDNFFHTHFNEIKEVL